MPSRKMVKVRFPVFLFLCFVSIIVAQDEKDELFTQRDKILKEIEYTSKLLDETAEKKSINIEKLNLLGKKILQRWELIRLYEIQISELNTKIADYELSISILEKELKKQRNAYAGFILYSYKNYDNYTKGILLLASNDLSQFYLRKKYMEQLTEARKEKILIILKLEDKINHELALLVKGQREKENALASLQREHGNLSKEKLAREKQVKELAGEEKRLKGLIDEKKKIEKEIANRIEELIRAETKKGSKLDLTPEQKLLSKDFEKNKGRLPWPTKNGVITEHFGEHNHPVIKDLIIRNSGIDIATGTDEAVRAIFDGEVSKIFAIKGANYTLIMKHGSYYSVYHNLYDVHVKVGDSIKTKDIIGKVSKNSSGDASVVHFELWKGLEKLDPEDWISN
jgi:septal ring factor EnvC (AmiA/AmiB activator)